MPRIKIDDQEVEVQQGASVLDAARQLGIDVPTLCYLEGCEPNTACLACLVRLKGQGRMVPSCATVAAEGMEVESESAEVKKARKTAIELLLSDHVGDCIAPCETTCPAHMDIPLMIRQIEAGELRESLATVKKRIALPAILGRICPAPCEKGCRRGKWDTPVSICLLKRYVADVDLASGNPYDPPCKSVTGKRVAIVGSGPTGLAAAYYLQQEGHSSVVFDDHPEAGGQMRYGITEEELPRTIIDQEVDAIKRIGAEFQLNCKMGEDKTLQELRDHFDAVVLAVGETPKDVVEKMGLKATRTGVHINNATYETSLKGVFSGGDATQPRQLAVRSVGHGWAIAVSVGQYITGAPLTGAGKEFTSKIANISHDELEGFLNEAHERGRVDHDAVKKVGFTPEEAVAESERCLHCDCRARGNCKLQTYSEAYSCNQNHFKGDRRSFEQRSEHHGVIYEPGKCVSCNLCVQIARGAAEPLGLSFVGRGFSSRVAVPFDADMDEGLQKVAAKCADACPTGAIAVKDHYDLGSKVKGKPEKKEVSSKAE